MTAMAIRDIKAGEELSISCEFSTTTHQPRTSLPSVTIPATKQILDSELGLTHSERQSFLRSRWGFTCTCPLCTASPSAVIASDTRREEIRQIRDKVLALVHEREFKRAVGLYVEMLEIMDEEEMVAARGDHCAIVARMYGAVREWVEMEKWAGMAVEEMRLFGGEEVFEEVVEMEEMVRVARRQK